MAPLLSWRDPVEAETAYGLVMVGKVLLERDFPLHVVGGGGGAYIRQSLCHTIGAIGTSVKSFLFEFSSADQNCWTNNPRM